MTQNAERRIVPLQPRHIAQVADIERRVFSDPWSEGLLRAELENPLARWFVLESGGRVCGYVSTLDICGEVHVTNVAVPPEYRRRGIARELLRCAVDFARSTGAFSMTLEVRRSNAPAIALYRGFGFEPVGLRPRYYENPREDALLMTLILREDPLC